MGTVLDFPDQEELERRAELALRRLHIIGTLDGMYYLVYAVSRAARNPLVTRWITKDLYPDIAQKFGTTASRVERSIRTAI